MPNGHNDDYEGDINRTVARNIRDRRTSLGLTQKQLAYVSGVSMRTIYAVESGRFSIRMATAVHIATGLACTLEDLIRE
jgi:DNA-binding XRE family transcriptional regulator